MSEQNNLDIFILIVFLKQMHHTENKLIRIY